MEIKIPFKTPSVNHLYFNWNNRRILTKEARKLKEEINEIVRKSLPFVCSNLNDGLKVGVEIHENWLTKKGAVKKKDISNREKFLIDSVFDTLNIDDKFIFEQTMKKVQSDKEFAIIKIQEITKRFK
jgi:Holliday junction resolvase RusA-like endonuclease